MQLISKAQTCGLEEYVFIHATHTVQVHMFVPYFLIVCEGCVSSLMKLIIAVQGVTNK